MTPARLRGGTLCVVVGFLLAAWIGWLRAPSFHATMWNVDEGIEAVVAKTLLHGRVMYRDMADHRTPLSYYATAGLFAVTGASMTALHVLVAGLVATTAFFLFLLGRRTGGNASGGWTAVIFAALACYLFIPSDAYAAHTEWFLILFTTSAALLFCSSSAAVPSFGRSAGVGALLGLGFLSKQPGLVELGVPLGTLAYAGLMEGAAWRSIVRSAGGVLCGFAVVVGSVALLFALCGAWHDAAFYTWTYNTRYYGPETTWADRLLSPGPFFALLVRLYPLVFVAGILAALIVVFRLVQLRPLSADGHPRCYDCYAFLWCGGSLAGAMASGRSFDHYFIQCLPAFAWIAAWIPARLTGWAVQRGAQGRLPRIAGVAILAIFAGWLVARPLAARKVDAPPPDPALRLSAFVRSHTRPTDPIFVWGYNPDIYLYANRLPASRFVYCTFQTGLIPWTNLDPAKDTAYAIVPGSMDALMHDLQQRPPVFIVDCGFGPHRRFQKYPLRNFAPLRQLVEQHYVEIDPERYQAQGFRLFMRRDETPLTAAARNAPDGYPKHPTPSLGGPDVVRPGEAAFTASVWQQTGADSQRLSLIVDGGEYAGVRFPASQTLTFMVNVPFENEPGAKHRLSVAAYWSDGTRTSSEVKEVTVSNFHSTAEQRVAFALPLASAWLPATGIRALLPPRLDSNDGERSFALHAPSLVRYELPSNAAVVRGSFGFPAGAYAADNKSPTDGAEFIVRVVEADGTPHVLLKRLLRPRTEPADRPVQSFHLLLPKRGDGAALELEITPGPAKNTASDWTFWSDVVLETAPGSL